MPNWYPQDKKQLNSALDNFLKKSANTDGKPHGLIVPHAGYEFSGAVAGKSFALLKNSKFKKAVIIGPSHYIGFKGIKTFNETKTPLGKLKIIKNNFKELKELKVEHSVSNQFPFLQKLRFKEILSLVVGDITNIEAKEIAKELSKIKNAAYIFSTDLSHFLDYETAVERDKNSIKIIEKLDLEKFRFLDACGKFPLLVMMHLCKSNKWKPKLIEYKNSGDITDDKTSVVGYAGFWF